ncbi:hypothetical protein BJX70DRAFT_396806 [Aspergillus crustosus]
MALPIGAGDLVTAAMLLVHQVTRFRDSPSKVANAIREHKRLSEAVPEMKAHLATHNLPEEQKAALTDLITDYESRLNRVEPYLDKYRVVIEDKPSPWQRVQQVWRRFRWRQNKIGGRLEDASKTGQAFEKSIESMKR